MARILAVDDDPVMRTLIAKALEPLGHSVFFASDGVHALDALRCNSDIELLITDISMPILDGRQLISTIVKDESMVTIPILITSGVVGVNDIADLIDLGATKFVPKPINMESFRKDVVECLELCPIYCKI